MAQRWPYDGDPDDLSRARAHAHPTRPRDIAHARPDQTASGGEEEWTWTWRHRRELAPLIAIAGIVGATTLGWLERPDLAWLPVPVGAGATIVALLRVDRDAERWYAGLVGAAVTLWSVASWRAGIGNPGVLASLLAIAVPATVIWLRHQLPRSRVEVVGGSWPERRRAGRELGSVFERWAASAWRAKVPGSEVRRAVADLEQGTYTLYVDLAPGQYVDDLHLRRVASLLGVHRDDVRVLEGDREDEAVIEWLVRDAGELQGPPEDEDESAPYLEVVQPERPEPVDVADDRDTRLLASLRGEGPAYGKELARRTNLPHDWVWKRLPVLERDGAVSKVDGRWVAAGEER